MLNRSYNKSTTYPKTSNLDNNYSLFCLLQNFTNIISIVSKFMMYINRLTFISLRSEFKQLSFYFHLWVIIFVIYIFSIARFIIDDGVCWIKCGIEPP